MARIEGEPRNCQPCDFLREGIKGSLCGKTGSWIKDTRVCPTGPMLQIPEHGSDMPQLIQKVELYWRRQGDSHE